MTVTLRYSHSRRPRPCNTIWKWRRRSKAAETGGSKPVHRFDPLRYPDFDGLVAYTQIKLPSRPKLELARN